MQSTAASEQSPLDSRTAASFAATHESPGWGMPLCLAALIFFVYLFISFNSSIWDRDEARFARATAEMVSTGNYLYPTFNGKLRPDKPILIYWLMSIPVRLFGHDEWAYRLCSVVGTTLACLFAYSIGRRLFNHRTGLWAMALVAANPLMVYTGAVATSDAVLLAFITGSFAVFADALASRLSAKHAAALIVLFSGGMLTKGPVSLLPLIPFILTLILLRRDLGNPLPAILKIAATAVAACLIFLAWFIPANNATHNDLYNQMFLHHVGERMVKPLEGHGGYSFFYLIFYFLAVIAGFFPWTLYLPGALMALRVGDNAHKRGRVLLWTWIATFLIVMIAISTKLPHYILPIWPALALFVGAYLDKAEKGANADAPPANGPWTALGGFLFLAVALALALGIGFGPEYLGGKLGDGLPSDFGLSGVRNLLHPKNPNPLWLPYADESRSIRSVFAALLLIVALPLLFRHKSAHFSANAITLLVTIVLSVVLMGSLLMPGFERIKISQQLAAQIHARVADDTPVTVCGYNEASLIFYLNRNIEDVVPDRSGTAGAKGDPKHETRLDPQAAAKIVEQSIVDWAKKRGKGVLIIPRPMYEKMKLTGLLPDLDTVGEVKNGFNYSKGHWVDVLALRRDN